MLRLAPLRRQQSRRQPIEIFDRGIGDWVGSRVFLALFRGGVMVEVVLGENDSLDWALKKFRRKMIRSGLFKDMKKRRYYEKPSEARKRKAAAAKRRRARARRRSG